MARTEREECDASGERRQQCSDGAVDDRGAERIVERGAEAVEHHRDRSLDDAESAGEERDPAGDRPDAPGEQGELRVDVESREVRLGSELLKLTPTEFDLLRFLMQQAGKVLTHRMLLTEVWGPDFENHVQYLRVFVGQLRKKIERDPARPRYLLTETGVGYRFAQDAES